MNNPVRSAGLQCVSLLFARHTAGASWKTRAPRDVQGGASCFLVENGELKVENGDRRKLMVNG
jgi:hypothetical protein